MAEQENQRLYIGTEVFITPDPLVSPVSINEVIKGVAKNPRAFDKAAHEKLLFDYKNLYEVIFIPRYLSIYERERGGYWEGFLRTFCALTYDKRMQKPTENAIKSYIRDITVYSSKSLLYRMVEKETNLSEMLYCFTQYRSDKESYLLGAIDVYYPFAKRATGDIIENVMAPSLNDSGERSNVRAGNNQLL